MPPKANPASALEAVGQPTLQEFGRPERMLDVHFYRIAYEDAANLSDADLVAVARSGRLPAERPLNPTEFIQHAIATKQLPADFHPRNYRVHNEALWGPGRADWEAALHYLKFGQAAGAQWGRDLDHDFYCQLYMPDADAADKTRVQAHWCVHPNAYGSLKDALVRNDWRDGAWTVAFDHQSYVVYNSLIERLRTPMQALVHFIEDGWRDCLAMSADLEFDPALYADLAGVQVTLTPRDAYRLWIEGSFAIGTPANEGGFLRALGLTISHYPEGFDWRTYLEEWPAAGAMTRNAGRLPGRWDALEHLVRHGVLNGCCRLPITASAMQGLLLAAGDRFARMKMETEAAQCYDRALLYPDASSHLLRHAGDQLIRLGHHARALGMYRRARAAGASSFWTWCNGAEAALAVGLWAEAAEWVLSGLTEHPSSARLQTLLLRIQRAHYDHAVARHVGALRAGRSDTGISLALDEIFNLFLRSHRASFGVTSAPRRLSEGRLRIVVLANKDLAQCTFYRVDLKEVQLGMAGDVDLQIFERSQDEAFRSAAATADIAIFYRLASSVEVLHSIAVCRENGILTVYEVDDLVFDADAFPDPLELYDGGITAEEHLALRAGVALVHHAVASCDAAIASTEYLATHLSKLVRTGRTIVNRNGLSQSLAALARVSVPRPALWGDATVTFFYGSGTRAHGADFRELLAPALIQLMTERPEVRFVACGHVNVALLAARFPGRVEKIDPVANRDAYLSQLLSVDVNLAVLRTGRFNDCKSEIKWLEAAAFCVPSVVSDVKGYRETLVDGNHVVLVRPDPAAWYTALRGLVLDAARRATIGAAARDRALELYAPDTLGRALADGLWQLTRPEAVSAKAKRSIKPTVCAAPRRPRVLLANVFFPPQGIGGATRVVRDQAAELVASYADRYDIGILCGNDEDVTPYMTGAYTWHDIPVWSIGCPQREHMDWIAFDPAMAAPVGAVLDSFKPDLVHAHCIQRLSATMLEQVAARGVPYVVTAHDAWWISDHQFLMDAQDRLRMPWDNERFESPGNSHLREESWSRRLRLRGVLDAAAAVLVVSETFAAIYRRAGVTKALAVPNGLPELPPLEPSPPLPGRVRLAHLGGVMAHKGYFLVRQALARGRFDKLDLLVMDHDLKLGEERREVWGATPVLVTGRVPQERVGVLYGRFDVLLAPSLWPESFGLVTREALHYGKWVVASDRGAIGEDVTPGQNGWIVDVSSPVALTQAFAGMQGNPKRYANAPVLRVSGRTVRQQVDDVVQVYENALRRLP